MGMSNSGCCCTNKKGICSICEPELEICCLKIEHSGWSVTSPILLKDNAEALWEYGSSCPPEGTATEYCGHLSSVWGQEWREWQDCLPSIGLTWKPIDGDCNRIALTLFMQSGACISFNALGTDYQIQATATIEEDSDWPTRTIEFPDPLYPLLTGFDPDKYPPADYTVRVSLCEEGYVAFPDPAGEVILQGVFQEKFSTGDWIDVAPCRAGYNYYDTGVAVVRGGCTCGGEQCIPESGVDINRIDLFWCMDLYRKTVRLDGYGLFICGAPADGHLEVPATECGWDQAEYFIPLYLDKENQRMRVQPLDEFNCSSGGTPEPPPEWCKKPRLCVMLAVNDGADYQYYTLVWNDGTNQYELAPSEVPGGKPYTIEITLKEDPTELPGGSPSGSRAWVLTVVIKEVPSGDVVLTYETVYVIDCTESWVYPAVLDVPGEEYDWTLSIGTSCPEPPEPPDPPECEFGCWPECVKCPTPKTLYASFDSSPSCCVAGTYALTWVPTGGSSLPLAGYYELPSSIGGPIDTCGVVDFLRVYCIDSSSIMVQLHYLRAEGAEIDHTAPPLTLAVSCTGGHLESAPFNIPGRSKGRESLCGFGSGVGTNLRIISS